jgi:hypothetical protein
MYELIQTDKDQENNKEKKMDTDISNVIINLVENNESTRRIVLIKCNASKHDEFQI